MSLKAAWYEPAHGRAEAGTAQAELLTGGTPQGQQESPPAGVCLPPATGAFPKPSPPLQQDLTQIQMLRWVFPARNSPALP